jgi:hypothetical protein
MDEDFLLQQGKKHRVDEVFSTKAFQRLNKSGARQGNLRVIMAFEGNAFRSK